MYDIKCTWFFRKFYWETVVFNGKLPWEINETNGDGRMKNHPTRTRGNEEQDVVGKETALELIVKNLTNLYWDLTWV